MDAEDLYTLTINCKIKNSRKGKPRNKCRKIYSRFKKLKIKIIKKRKEKKEDLKKRKKTERKRKTPQNFKSPT